MTLLARRLGERKHDDLSLEQAWEELVADARVSGALIIAIGLLWGNSVFRGDFTVMSIIFDGLGVFFIIRGLVSIYRAKQQEQAMPPAAPAAPPPVRR